MGAAVKVDVEENVQIIRVPSLVDKEAVANFAKQVPRWLLDPSILHVFDFANASFLNAEIYKVVIAYRRALIKNSKHFASVGLLPHFQQEINQLGLNQAFNSVKDVHQAKLQAGLLDPSKSAPKIGSAVLNPFIEGTVSALKIQAGLEIKTGKPHLKNDTEPVCEIAGVITMNNPVMPGSIAICFPKAVFLGLYESMVGEKHGEITAEIQDGAGELLNIIYGHAKAKLKAEGHAFEMAIPAILVGEKLKMQIGERGRAVIIPFECVHGSFYLEVYFKKLSNV